MNNIENKLKIILPNIQKYVNKYDFFDEENKVAINIIPMLKYARTLEIESESQIKDIMYNKRLEADKNEIRLFQIWESEINEERTKNIIFYDIIGTWVGKYEERIFARKCEVKEVKAAEAMEFLENNHQQGERISAVKIGLYFNGVLKGLQTYFEDKRIKAYPDKKLYVLTRTVFQKNCQIVGGISKMNKYFKDIYDPDIIFDYSDRRLFCSWGHYTMGFKEENREIINPCLYYTDGKNLYYRESVRKKWRDGMRNAGIWEKERPKGWDSYSWNYAVNSEKIGLPNLYRVYDAGKNLNKWFKEN
jgi:hypothetical protein